MEHTSSTEKAVQFISGGGCSRQVSVPASLSFLPLEALGWFWVKHRKGLRREGIASGVALARSRGPIILPAPPEDSSRLGTLFRTNPYHVYLNCFPTNQCLQITGELPSLCCRRKIGLCEIVGVIAPLYSVAGTDRLASLFIAVVFLRYWGISHFSGALLNYFWVSKCVTSPFSTNCSVLHSDFPARDFCLL